MDNGRPGETGRKLVFLHIPKTGGTTLHRLLAHQFRPEEICPQRFNRLHELPAAELARYRLFSGHFDFDSIQCIPGETYVFTALRDPRDRVLSLYYFWSRIKPEVIEAQGLDGPRLARSLGLLDFLRRREGSVSDAIRNELARRLAGAVDVAEDGTSYVRNGGRLDPRQASQPMAEAEVVHRAIANLARIDAVGFIDDLDALYARVARDFGLQPVAAVPPLNTRHEEWPHLDPVREEPMTPEIARELDALTALDREVYAEARQRYGGRG